jgi:hypothetical protein
LQAILLGNLQFKNEYCFDYRSRLTGGIIEIPMGFLLCESVWSIIGSGNPALENQCGLRALEKKK